LELLGVEIEVWKEDFSFLAGEEGMVKLKMPRFVAMVGFLRGLWHWRTPHYSQLPDVCGNDCYCIPPKT